MPWFRKIRLSDHHWCKSVRILSAISGAEIREASETAFNASSLNVTDSIVSAQASAASGSTGAIVRANSATAGSTTALP